ncbi:hypothetical protein LF941_18290 [Pectobacterium versatile]|uniref:hypothetical protein n=1 Tax=Pectobacterium versatile TaxID=2488639 RepID=UPI001CF10953|nr:hypothetical protein [Pectobacterium versatile]MCA6917339.1 hypothetical protein [Pectobacterium versatile]
MGSIDLKTVSAVTIHGVLEKYLIDSEIEDDGEIAVDESARFFIKIDSESRLLTFYTNIKLTDKNSVPLDILSTFVSRLNIVSDSVRFSFFDEKTIHCDSSIPLDGSIDDTFFIRLVKNIQKNLVSAQSLSNDIPHFISQTNNPD